MKFNTAMPHHVHTAVDGDNSGTSDTAQTPATDSTDNSPDDTVDVSIEALQERVARAKLQATKAAKEQLTKKYGDLDELKKSADRLRQIEDANKTEHQRITDELAAAKAAAETAQAESVRYRVAATNGVTGDDIDLIGSGDETALTERAKRVGVLVAAERELNELKKKAEDDAAGKKAPVTGRPVAPGWGPGASPVDVGQKRSARDAGNDAAVALGWVK